MIPKVDKLIIDILLRICSMLTKYSERIPPYEIFSIRNMVEEVAKNGDKR